jgi:hypothetical protein
MEVEKHFLSNPQNENAPLSAMLKQVMEDLNTYRMCTFTGLWCKVIPCHQYYLSTVYFQGLSKIPEPTRGEITK